MNLFDDDVFFTSIALLLEKYQVICCFLVSSFVLFCLRSFGFLKGEGGSSISKDNLNCEITNPGTGNMAV